jgi:hypothetical protein
VSLTCIACKLMEHIITSNTMAHGIRKGLSCDTHLSNL